jgi:hypothetical protein
MMGVEGRKNLSLGQEKHQIGVDYSGRSDILVSSGDERHIDSRRAT